MLGWKVKSTLSVGFVFVFSFPSLLLVFLLERYEMSMKLYKMVELINFIRILITFLKGNGIFFFTFLRLLSKEFTNVLNTCKFYKLK